MVLSVFAYEDVNKLKASRSGSYFAYSDDGIKWSEPEVLFVTQCGVYNGCETVMHPNLYLEKETAHYATGWLLYGYSPCFGTKPPGIPHYMAGRGQSP